MLQRTEEWFEIRKGRFTASRISELLADGRRDMTDEEMIQYKKDNPKGKRKTIDTHGDGLDTYAFNKSVEVVYGLEEEEEFLSKDMQRGIELEPLAFDKFKGIKELEFMEVNECSFFPFGTHAGASPDGLVNKDAILEIKCPKRNKFFKYVANGSKEIDSKYIAQIQMQMMCTNSNRAYFFNYLIDNGKEYWHEIIIERDEVMIQLIKDRIEIATKIKLEYIDKLKNNKQF